MKNKLYLLIKSSIILGSVLSLPLQVTAETTTYSSESAISNFSEPPMSISSTNNVSLSSSQSETASSNSTSNSTESSMVPLQTETSSTPSIPETRAADINAWIPDPVLQEIVAKAIGKTKEALTQEDMSKLTSLYIQNADSAIASLKGLELATNLDYFYMNSNNQISDFSVLAGLPNLKQVYLMGTNVTDQNVPDFGTTITRLDLSGSSVTNGV